MRTTLPGGIRTWNFIGLTLVVLLPMVAWAESPDLSVLGSDSARCNGVQAQQAAFEFHTVAAVVVAVSAALSVPVWWLTWRKDILSPVLSLIAAAALASVIAGGFIVFDPLASEARRALMANPGCWQFFVLGAAGSWGRGLVLGAVPAGALSLVSNVALKLLSNRG